MQFVSTPHIFRFIHRAIEKLLIFKFIVHNYYNLGKSVLTIAILIC